MKKSLFVFILLFTCMSIRVSGIEFSHKNYLKEIRKNVITIGVQNKDESLQDFKESHFAKYLKEELRLNIEVKKVNETEGIDELLSHRIDFLENVSLEENPKIKYLNYNLLNNIIIVCRKNYKYNINQLANKKVGLINKNEIKNFPIQLLSRNNNIRLYKNFNEMAKALESKEIDIGISDKENRFELLLYENIILVDNRRSWNWKEGIATTNAKYYKLLEIINNKIYENPKLINSFFDTEKDYKAKIKKAFYNSLSNEEREYIKNNKTISLVANKNSFPVLYVQANKLNGLLQYFMDMFSELTKMKLEYIDDKDKNVSDRSNLIEEKIEYEKYKKISNVIYETNLIKVCFNDNTLNPSLSSIPRVDKNIIGLIKQVKLNKNNEILKSNIKYYDNVDDSIDGLRKNDVNFILMDKAMFDYYSLTDRGKSLVEFKELDYPAIYYLDTSNKILSSVLEKVHKVYDIEKKINRTQWNNVKDYMQKKYIKNVYQYKELYKFLIILLIGASSIGIISFFLLRKNKDVTKKLEAILQGNSKLDIVEINLRSKTVRCKSGLLFSNEEIISLDEYLKIINLNIQDYLKQHTNKIIQQCNKIFVKGQDRYFKQYIYVSNNKKVICIITDITQEQIEKIELQEKVKIDSLTGLLNRDYYEEEIQKIIKGNPKAKGAFLFIDINDFKKFNDTFGHDFGDKVIKVIGAKLKSIEDCNTLSFRIAGDEFGVYKHKIKNKEELIDFLKNLCEKLTIQQNHNKVVINISCSIGCAVYYEDLKNIGILRNNAETEMYKCKKKKYNESRYRLYYSEENNKNKI